MRAGEGLAGGGGQGEEGGGEEGEGGQGGNVRGGGEDDLGQGWTYVSFDGKVCVRVYVCVCVGNVGVRMCVRACMCTSARVMARILFMCIDEYVEDMWCCSVLQCVEVCCSVSFCVC